MTTKIEQLNKVLIHIIDKGVNDKNIEIVKTLISEGADINIKNEDNHSLLNFAIEDDYDELLEYLIDNNVYITSEDIIQAMESNIDIEHKKNLIIHCSGKSDTQEESIINKFLSPEP